MPETMSSGYAAAEREAYRSVRRACDAGLDSMTLRAEVARRIARLIQADASYFGTLDLHTGLLADLVGEGASVEVERRFRQAAYGLGDADRTIDLGSSRRELRAAFAVGGGPGGVWLALRERHARPFGEHDLAFIRRIAPHIAGALRRAALVDAAQVASLDDLEDAARRGKPTPGVVVIDDRWRITQWTAAAEAQLADLADGSAATSAIINLVARQRTSGGAGGVGLLTVRGSSGRWYTLRATLAEPDERGRSSTVLIITPAARRPGAASLTRRGSGY